MIRGYLSSEDLDEVLCRRNQQHMQRFHLEKWEVFKKQAQWDLSPVNEGGVTGDEGRRR